jgi:hypothetical protein
MALKKQPDWSCIAFTAQKYLTRSIKLPLQQSVQCTRAGSTRAKETQRGPSIIWLIGYLRLQRGSPSASDTNPSNRILAIPAGRAKARGGPNKASRRLGKSRRTGPRRRGTRTRRRQSINRAHLPSPLLSWNSSYRFSADRSNDRYGQGATAGAGL